LLEAAQEGPRAQALVEASQRSAEPTSAAVTVALRRPDGAAAAQIIGLLPTAKLAEATGVRRLGDTGAIALLDRRHDRILAHPDRALVGASLDALPQAAALRALDAAAAPGAIAQRSGPWLVTRRPVRGLEWEVVAVQDIREALEPVNRLGAQALAVTGVFALVLGLTGITVGRRLVRPVNALEQLAFQDPLTGLATRRFFVAWLVQALELARRYQQPFSLIFLDLDNFKQVNDRYGHLLGDRVLQEAAARIRRGLRSSDMVVRYGGEEIVVALPQTGKDAALLVADALRMAVAGSPVAWDERGAPVTITISAGVASMPDDATDAQGLLERTDAALYRAKAQGRDQVVPA
jgi:diguanylate cyclase (GGDEF)-like protein